MNDYKDYFENPTFATLKEIAERNNEVARSLDVYSDKLALLKPLNDINERVTQNNPFIEHQKLIRDFEQFADYSSGLRSIIDYDTILAPLREVIDSITIPFPDFSLPEKYWKLQYFASDKDERVSSKEYKRALFEAKWFPFIGSNAEERDVFFEILEILIHTRKGNNRIKKIDKCIKDYYDIKQIKYLKARWREAKITKPIRQIMFQALDAFLEKKYALTLVPLVILWDSMILDISIDDINTRRTCKKVKNEFSNIISDNNQDKIFDAFFQQFIYYDCNSIDQVQEDVPGRHAIAHSWITKYPSKKAAINAIIFTDYLLDFLLW